MIEAKELAAGAELDRLVGEKVMNCRVVKQRGRNRWDIIIPGGVNVIDFAEEPTPEVAAKYFPCYSTDIAAAWRVVERMTRVPRSLDEAQAMTNTQFYYWWKSKPELCCCSATEAAAEICRAALAAVTHSAS